MSTYNPFSSDFLRRAADDRLRPQGTLSYVAGATDDPLKFTTIPQLLDRACARHGGRTAAVFAASGASLSWYDLRERSNDVAAGLLALGIGRGDRVGIWAPNCAEWLYVQFGTARIGAILVNINPAYRTSELEYALNKVGCKVLVMARRHKSSDYVEMLRSLAPQIDEEGSILRAAKLPHLKHVVILDNGPLPRSGRSFARLTADAGPGHRCRIETLSAALDPDDAINIQFTSGTTGAPKGATLSHFNVVNNARYAAKCMALSAEDRLCIPVPLYHCFGMVLGVLTCTAVGAAMVFPGGELRGRSYPFRRRSLQMHGAARRPDDVRCSARASEFFELRHVELADWDHGGGAVPDRDHASGDRSDAHERSHHWLWHDRD